MNNMSRNYKSKIVINVLVMIVSLFYIFPLWYAFNNAFKKKEFIATNPFALSLKSFTFDSIIQAYKLLQYPLAFFNSSVILILSIAMLVVLGSLAAYGITLSTSKLMGRVYTFFVALISVPFQIAIVPLIILLKKLDLINSFFGAAFVYTAMYLPFVIFLYVGFMRTIPKEMVEASTIDGCGPFKTYMHIYMPLLKTITGIVLIIRGVSIWNDLLVPLIVITTNSKYTLPLKLFIFNSSKVGQWDMIFAGTVLVCLPIVIMFLLLQRSFIKGIMAGSVKG